MNDVIGLRSATGATATSTGGYIVFEVAEGFFGLPLADVEGITAPPPVAAMPHASPALLGAGNVAGQIVPVIDASRLLRPAAAIRPYDGRGEILRLRMSEGGVGLWVDRVGSLASRSDDGETAFQLLDVRDFVSAALESPTLAGPEFTGAADTEDPAQSPGPAATARTVLASKETSVLVEAAGSPIALGHGAVLELLEHVPWTPVPRAPGAFLGVGVLRGSALPVLGLSQLLGHTTATQPGGFALMEIAGRRLLLAVERVIGLASGADHQPVDLRDVVPVDLREIVFAFSPTEEGASAHSTAPVEESAQYLSLELGRQQFALPVSAVERVIEATPLIRLPRGADDDELMSDTAGAIELRGQIIPVAAMRRRLGIAGPGIAGPGIAGPGIADGEDRGPAAYLIVRSNERQSAIGIDRIGEMISLRPHEIALPPGEPGLITGVAVLRGSETLSILAPEHLWRTF